MKIHHLSGGTMCPILGKVFVNETGTMVCHCLLIESDDGLVLVDTGFGLADIAEGGRRLGRAFAAVTGAPRDPAQAIVSQIAALGFKAADVRHIYLTHMDLDHAGGLGDFPGATVHVLANEHAAATARATGNERRRYKPVQWTDAKFELIPNDGEGDRWFGFEAVRPVPKLPGIAVVPLHGHTRGHAAIAVERDDAKGWLLHCGDAYFHATEMNAERPQGTFGLNVFQSVMALDNAVRKQNTVRLRDLARGHHAEVRVFCAHDPSEFKALSEKPPT